MTDEVDFVTEYLEEDIRAELAIVVDAAADETVRDSISRELGRGGQNHKAYVQVWFSGDCPDADFDADELVHIKFNPALQPREWEPKSAAAEPFVLNLPISTVLREVCEMLAEAEYADGVPVIPAGCTTQFVHVDDEEEGDKRPLDVSQTLVDLLSAREPGCNIFFLGVQGQHAVKRAWL